MKLKLILLLIFTLSVPSLWAYDVEVNGIYYDLVKKGNVAKVTGKDKSGNWGDGNIVIPETITVNNIDYTIDEISSMAFAGTSITSIIIPNTVTIIGRSAFYRCIDLKSVILSNNLERIEDNCFEDCWNLKSISLPETLKSIGNYSFKYCSSLTSIQIPPSLTRIGTGAFQYCTKIKAININSLESWLSIDNSSLIIDNEDAILYIDGDPLINVVIPPSITKIKGGAFCNNKKIESVIISNSVTEIGGSAFSGCINLSDITWSTSLQTIGESAFSGCSKLTGCLEIPSSVEGISFNAFDGCSGFSTLIIPSKVKRINSEAFGHMENLIDVYCYAENVPSSIYHMNGDEIVGIFYKSYIEYATLHVPQTAIEQYKASSLWHQFGKIEAIKAPGMKDPEKCAKPEICYSYGKITFSSATDNAEFISKVTDSDIKDYYSAEIVLSATYNISVYATKPGYIDSEPATATLCWLESDPKTEGINDLTRLSTTPVLISSSGRTLNITGAENANHVEFYNLSGSYLGTEPIINGEATFETNEDLVIVKIGDKSIKVKKQQ